MRGESTSSSEPDGLCDSDSTAGRAKDRRLQARVQHYQRYPVGGQEYHAYRVNPVQDKTRLAALNKAFELAQGNARQLIALGEGLYQLREVSGFGSAWDECEELLQQTSPFPCVRIDASPVIQGLQNICRGPSNRRPPLPWRYIRPGAICARRGSCRYCPRSGISLSDR